MFHRIFLSKIWSKEIPTEVLSASGNWNCLNVYFATANERALFIYVIKRNTTNNYTRRLFSRENESVLFFWTQQADTIVIG
jgi:hypothetical protein